MSFQIRKSKSLSMTLPAFFLAAIVITLLCAPSLHAKDNPNPYLKSFELAAEGHFEEAAESLKKALGTQKSLFLVSDCITAAEDAINKKIPEKAAKLFFRALLLVEDKEDTKALIMLSKAIKLYPAYVSAYQRRGILYEDNSLLKKALKDLDKAIELDKKNSRSYYFRGLMYTRPNTYKEAISNYTKAIELKPTGISAYNGRGAVYLLKGVYDKAIADFTKSIELHPKNYYAYLNRASAYSVLDQNIKSLYDYSKAIEIDPQNASAYNNRGVLYITGFEEPQKACLDFKQACDLGECKKYYRSIDYEVCKGDGTKTISPEDYDEKSKGIALALESRFLEARKIFEEILRFEPSSIRAINSLSLIDDVLSKKISKKTALKSFDAYYFINKDMWPEAIEELNKALEITPDIAVNHYNRAVSYFMTGQYKKAIDDFTKTVELDPSNDWAYYVRGVTHLENDDRGNAISDFTMAIEQNPSMKEAYLARGESYAEGGNYLRAVRDLTWLIENDPPNAARGLLQESINARPRNEVQQSNLRLYKGLRARVSR